MATSDLAMKIASLAARFQVPNPELLGSGDSYAGVDQTKVIGYPTPTQHSDLGPPEKISGYELKKLPESGASWHILAGEQDG